MCRKVLLVASKLGYQTRVFGAAAEKLGLELVMATDRCHQLENPWGDDAIPLRFETPESAAEGLTEGIHAEGIVAVGDRAAHVASYLARQLGLAFHAPEGTAAGRNKFAARERFQHAGLVAPEYHRVPLDADEVEASRTARFPCVLKPLGLAGSRGVIRADGEAGFVKAFQRIRAILSAGEIARFQDEADRYVQVESYIAGREFTVEGLVTRGLLEVLAIFDKPVPLEGPFFEETIYVTPSRETVAVQRAMIEAAQRAVSALGLDQGPIHAEMRVDERGTVWLLEVAGRPIGGLCAKALRFHPDVTLEELILRHALGQPVEGVTLADGASGVMMIPVSRGGVYESVAGVEDAMAVRGIWAVEITAKQGQVFAPPPDGDSYPGFLFARDAQPQEVERALRDAHACLKFEMREVLPVVGRGSG